MPYQCFTDDDNPPVLLVTNLAEGDTMAVCADHLADYALGMLQSVTGQEWGVTASYPDQETGDETDEDADADAAPPAPTPEQVPADPETEGVAAEPDAEDQEGEDQVAEDNAVRDADLREELAGHSQR